MPGAAAARVRSGSLANRTVRWTMAGQHRPKPTPGSSTQTTMPASEPAGTTTANPAEPTTTSAAPTRINIRPAASGAAAIAMVAALQANASPARI